MEYFFENTKKMVESETWKNNDKLNCVYTDALCCSESSQKRGRHFSQQGNQDLGTNKPPEI